MEEKKNRWLIAASAVGIHLCIGSVYAWSVYTAPLTDQLGWNLADTQFTFSLAIFILGISAAFLGHFLEKKGPGRAGFLAAVFFGVGIIGAGVAVLIESVYLLYLFYGLFGGIGLGLGYITPIATLIKWFPDKPGLATGLAVMGFGFAALLNGPLIAFLIESVGIAGSFFITGSTYFLIMLLCSRYLSLPPVDFTAGKKAAELNDKKAGKLVAELSGAMAVRTRRFWYLWLMFFINISCGIAIISVASPMALEYTGMTVAGAAAMVGIMGLFNGAGRLGWASLSDRVGRPAVFSLFFALQMIAFYLLPAVEEELYFQALIFLILSCYGGGFASMPAYIGDLFGTRQMGIIFGYILTAWAAAGMAGPLVTAWGRTVTDSYDGPLYFFAGLMGVALLISILVRFDINKSREKSNAKPDVQ